MTTSAEVLKLFQADDSDRIDCYLAKPMVASHGAVSAFAICGHLLDPQTKEAQRQQLWLQIPGQELARLIQALTDLARKRGVQIPSGPGEQFSTPPKKGLN